MLHSSLTPLRVVYTKQPKLGWFFLSDRFCQAVCPLFVSIQLTDITLHKIRRRDRKIPISKSVGESGKIGWTAWQNRLDMQNIKSAIVCVNGALAGPNNKLSCRNPLFFTRSPWILIFPMTIDGTRYRKRQLGSMQQTFYGCKNSKRVVNSNK